MNRRSISLLVSLLALVVVIFGSVYFLQVTRDIEQQEDALVVSAQIEPQEAEQSIADIPAEKPFFADITAVQQEIDNWAASLPQGSSASVVVADTDGTVLAEYNKDESYFAASIYKLYVAYAGYQQVDATVVEPEELYVNGNTRIECLDLMIRDSDSPCAEKLWNELGKQELTDQLIGYGIKDSSMTNITTTASDAAIMLGRIVRGQGLELPSKTAFLESMKEQIYTRALRTGFSDAVTVYSKVGFRDLDEYHDVGIIELANGRQAILSVMTNNVGTSRIADLASSLELLIEK